MMTQAQIEMRQEMIDDERRQFQKENSLYQKWLDNNRDELTELFLEEFGEEFNGFCEMAFENRNE